MDKSWKNVVKETNREFMHDAGSMFSLFLVLLLIAFIISSIVMCFILHPLLGFFMIPFNITGGYWLFKFLGNIIYYKVKK